MKKFFRIGSRPSPLARKQTQELQKLFPKFVFDFIYIVTIGDQDKSTPLSQVEDGDFFTREIDQA
ncbi:MAG: hydroxymethylbilane synthase, partial [Candidatus Omnitrophica bacterium]|nr:hydroxymethylbilane synthase [Candidatus Omnitrophota bacterium]